MEQEMRDKMEEIYRVRDKMGWGEWGGEGPAINRGSTVHIALGTKRILSLFFSLQLRLWVVSFQEGLAKTKQFQYPRTITADNAKPLHSWESPIWLICGFHSKSLHTDGEILLQCKWDWNSEIQHHAARPFLSSTSKRCPMNRSFRPNVNHVWPPSHDWHLITFPLFKKSYKDC